MYNLQQDTALLSGMSNSMEIDSLGSVVLNNDSLKELSDMMNDLGLSRNELQSLQEDNEILTLMAQVCVCVCYCCYYYYHHHYYYYY